MSKPVLGRGLGELMTQPVASAPNERPAAQESSPAMGVSSLFRGGRQENVFAEPLPPEAEKVFPPETERQRVQTGKTILPAWYLFAADVLLVAISFLLIFRARQTVDTATLAFGIGAIILGALLSIAAVFLSEPKS